MGLRVVGAARRRRRGAPTARGRAAGAAPRPPAQVANDLKLTAAEAASQKEQREALAEEFDPDKDARKDQIARIRQRLQMAQAEAAAEAMRGGPGRDM